MLLPFVCCYCNFLLFGSIGLVVGGCEKRKNKKTRRDRGDARRVVVVNALFSSSRYLSITYIHTYILLVLHHLQHTTTTYKKQ